MTAYSYLSALLAMIGLLVVVDWRFKLAFFYQWRRASKTIGLAVSMFIIWDLMGIGLHIFFSGHSAFVTGVKLLPNFPVEELFFLTAFCYLTLVLWVLGGRYADVRRS